jgi:hypothetical protein
MQKEPKEKNSAYCGEAGARREFEGNPEHDAHVALIKASKALKKAGGTEVGRRITWYNTTPEIRAMYGVDKLNDCVEVFTKAHSEFIVLVEKFKGERLYSEFFASMIKNRKLWFDLFTMDDNYVLAECSVGMLGTLATIYRQRGELKKAACVLGISPFI